MRNTLGALMGGVRGLDRKIMLEHAVEFDLPLTQLIADLAPVPFDTESPIVTLEPHHVASVLERFLGGWLSSHDVVGWAELLEVRDDVAFSPDAGSVVREAIFMLANPEINLPGGALDRDGASVVRDMLQG